MCIYVIVIILNFGSADVQGVTSAFCILSLESRDTFAKVSILSLSLRMICSIDWLLNGDHREDG